MLHAGSVAWVSSVSGVRHTTPKRLGGGETGMAHTVRDEIGRLYEKHRAYLLKVARQLGALYPEDVVQKAVVWWLGQKNIGEVDLGAFERQIKRVIHKDQNVPCRTKDGFGYRPAPVEIHGDIDMLFRRRHGRRVGPKKGAE